MRDPSGVCCFCDNSFVAPACVCAPSDSILCDCARVLVNQSHLELRQSFPRGE